MPLRVSMMPFNPSTHADLKQLRVHIDIIFIKDHNFFFAIIQKILQNQAKTRNHRRYAQKWEGTYPHLLVG